MIEHVETIPRYCIRSDTPDFLNTGALITAHILATSYLVLLAIRIKKISVLIADGAYKRRPRSEGLFVHFNKQQYRYVFT